MSRFKRIKNKSNKKSSVSINEKIAALNKELKKTGILKEGLPTNSSRGIYSTSTHVPADPGGEFPIPDTTGVTGAGFVQPVSGNPNDSSNWPDAYTDNSWMRNSNTVNGVANQPIVASFDDALLATDTSGRYPTGGAGIAFGNQAFGVSVGYIRNGFYHQVLKPGLLGGTVTVPQDATGHPYFGLFGEYFPADENRQAILKAASARYNAVNVPGAGKIPVKAWTPHNNFHMGPFADYSGPKVTVGGQNYVLQTFQMFTASNTFFVSPTPATTTNPIIRGIGDIEYHGPITPGRLFGLSDQGYNYLDGKSKRRLRKGTIYRTAGGGAYPTTGRTTTFTTGSRLQSAQPQPITDPTTTQTQQSSEPTFPSSPSDAYEPETVEVEITPADIPDEFKTDSQDKPSAKGVTLTKWMSRADFNKMYPDAISNEFINGVYVDDYLDALPYRSTDFMSPNPDFPGAWDLNTRAYNNYIMTGDLSGLGNSSGIPKPRHQKATPEPEQKMYGGKTYEELMADLDKTIEKYSTMEKQAYDEMRQIALELGMDFVSLIGGLFTGGTTAAPVLGKLGMKLLKKYGKTVAGKMIRKLIKKFRNKKNSKKLDELLDDIDNAEAQEYDPRKPFEPDAGDQYPNLTRKGEQTYDTATERLLNQRRQGGPDGELAGRLLDDLVDAASKGDTALNSVMNKIKKSPIGYLFNSYKPNGKLLSEATKLGHFEPEELNVDIEKLRKGIMPEYPKKPPAKMVDGYHQDSQLKPKELNKEPYLKIDEKDLIRNHRLKPNEAQGMMQTIDRINDHIKKHPEDLIHAQMRYPIDDPRLAELNWRMDQMLDAGEEYLDTNFKVNDKLFKRAIDRTKKNIKLTDPEYVQQHYDELRGTTKPKKTKLVGRLGKHLNKYESKSFFKHVNSKDFKKISERKEQQKLLKLENETILNRKIEEEENYLESVMKQVKYSWREYDAAAELREGMTTSNLTITQVAAQGEGEDSLATLDLSVADSFSDNTDRDAPVSGLKNTAIVDGGTGNGSMGGFDIGPHVRFRGNSQPRWATLNAVDTSVSDTIVLSAIRGSDFNGGEIPDLDNEALQLWYHDSVNNAWRPLNQNPLGVTDNTVNHIIIPNVPGEGSIPPENKVLRDWTLTLPSWARGPEMKFMFYQAQHSGASYDHYGIKSVSYRRNTPLTVFAPLDSPEASAFIRMNPIPYNKRRKNIQDRLAPKSRKKNLEKMLEASDKYVATYLGPDFPGMNTEIVPITLQTFEQQSAAIEARDDIVSKIQSLAKPSVEKYTSMVDKNVSDYYARHYRESANDLNSFGQMYQNAIDTQNYDQANDLVRNASKNVVYALDGTMPIFDKSGELTQVPVRDRYGRVYNPNYKLTQEQTDKIDARYGVSTESALRARNESPFAYTLNTNFETTEELLEDDSYDLKSTDYITGPDPWSTGVSYSDPVDKQGGKSNTGSRYVPWYGGKGFRMFRGPDKPTTWDQKGWYPSRVGTNHWQGHRFDGLAYGAFRALYLGDERFKKTPANGMSQAANLAYYLNYANTSWHFKTDYTKTITYRNGQTVTTKHSRPGTNRCGMSYFSDWMESLPRLREEMGLPPLTKDPLIAALREEQAQIPNVDEPIDQGEEGENKDKGLFGLEGVTDDFTELDFELINEDGDGFTKDELDDMGNFWKDLLTHKPTRDEYDNTRSGAKRYSEDLKAYKQNQETIAKNTKIIDYYRNTLASIASRDENGKFDPEKYKAMFKEGENSFFISSMDYEIGEVNFLLGSAAERNPFGSDIATFDKENTLAYDFSNGVNLGLSSQNMADLFSGGGRRIVTAANGKSYTKFQDLDWEYKEDAINAFNAFRDSERDRLFTDVDFENLSFGDNVFSTQQAFQDHLNLERAKSMTASNLMYASLANRLVEVENGFTPVLGAKQDFGAMNDAGTKVSGQSFPPDTNFDLVPIDSDGFFTREFNANIDKPKGSNLTYTQIAQLNDQLSVVGDNGMRRLYQAQARGASEEELGAIAASIWQQEKPISDKLALDYDSMFSPDGKISPTLNSILNNPLSNAIKSLADVVTFDTFDIDNKGRSTNPIVNKINSSVRQLPGDAAMFIRYLTNTGPKVIDNKTLGEKRVETMFRNAETKGGGENALNFNDNIAGTTQEPVYKNGKINIAFNYDFEKNATEFQTAKENNAYVESWAGKIMKSITGSDNLGNKILEPLTKAMYNVMGEYSVDAQPSFPVVGTILGPIFGQAIETSKSVGGAKAIPGNVSITPKELYRINPNLYREYVNKGVIPDTERDYYGGYNTGSRIIPYDQAPYFSKDKKKKDEGTFDVDMNYFPPGFEDAIRTNEIGDTQGQFMPSNPPGMRQQGVGVSANDLSRNQSQAQINAALRKMMDRHDAALRKLKASQLNPNDKKSMDAVEKLVLAQEKERRPLANALFLEPTAQATGISNAKLNNLSDKGYDLARINDVLVYKDGKDIIKDFSDDLIADHIATPINDKIKLDKLMDLKKNLLWRYLTKQIKPLTEKNISYGMQQNIYSQLQQLLRNPNHPAVNDNGRVVYDKTDEFSDEVKKMYGWKPGYRILQVSAYGVKPGKDVYEPGVFEGNKLDTLFGRVTIVTGSEDYWGDGSMETEIISVHDDFDFDYGFNLKRSYEGGDVPGAPYDDPNKRYKGPEHPLIPGRGEFAGATDYVDTMVARVGRSIVNTSSWLNLGFPVPINIKFDRNSKRNNWRYKDDFPSPNYNESKEPTRGETLYEKVKKKVFFNPKDIKPEFPKDPPPELDPETGMHPEYGKHVSRYKKLDPHSADAMPDTGDPEIDAEVMKQKSGKKKKKLSDFKRNIK